MEYLSWKDKNFSVLCITAKTNFHFIFSMFKAEIVHDFYFIYIVITYYLLMCFVQDGAALK